MNEISEKSSVWRNKTIPRYSMTVCTSTVVCGSRWGREVGTGIVTADFFLDSSEIDNLETELEIFFSHFTKSKAIRPLRLKGLLSGKEYEKRKHY